MSGGQTGAQSGSGTTSNPGANQGNPQSAKTGEDRSFGAERPGHRSLVWRRAPKP